MPMIPLAATQNFQFLTPTFFGPVPFGDAFQRASAVAATCESDLTTLQDWFGVPAGLFGRSNPIKVVIDNLDFGLGNNGGYDKNGGTQINIIPFSGSANADDAARAVFVAELSEIMMSIGNQWNSGNSMGEALSTVCEALIHDYGYYQGYDGSSPVGPRIQYWLNYPRTDWLHRHRPNWIDCTEDTDTNFVSFGCGIVFIYYLMSLGYTINEIIASGGDTFEKTYQNLTKKSGGWRALTDLLDFHFPESPLVSYNVSSDNLFPLPQLSGITIMPPSVVTGGWASGTVTLSGPQGDALVTLLSEDTRFASVPSNVNILKGGTSQNFTVNAPLITTPFSPTKVMIYASYGGSTVAATLTVQPVVGVLKSLTLNPSTVVGGTSTTATVTLEAPVPTPTLVGLAAMDSAAGPGIPHGTPSSLARARPSITIPANEPQYTFAVETSPIAGPLIAHATIVAGAVVTKTAVLTIEAG